MLKASASSEVHPAQNFSATATTPIFALPSFLRTTRLQLACTDTGTDQLACKNCYGSRAATRSLHQHGQNAHRWAVTDPSTSPLGEMFDEAFHVQSEGVRD